MEPKLFMLLLGCKPEGRFTEQHDIFFGIAESLKDLIPAINGFWPQAKEKIHIDVWREVSSVDGVLIKVVPRTAQLAPFKSDKKLFFLNLGGYKKDDFEEYHYKMLCVGQDKTEAITKARETAFYKHTGFKGATSHIDDKYGIDVDDVYEISDILPVSMKEKYRIEITGTEKDEDKIHAGYLKLNKIS